MTLYYLAHLGLQVAVAIRVLTRPGREPSSRVAWLAVVFALPIVGILGYLVLGETSIGRDRLARKASVNDRLATLSRGGNPLRLDNAAEVPERFRSVFHLGERISGFPVVGGNTAALMADSDAAIDAMVADIDAAQDHVHILFYIWLTDANGTRMIDAVIRAARRGVTCRAMVDDLGSRTLVRSPRWAEMGDSGVQLARALEIGNPVKRLFDGRIDLRNHRKILVVDNRVTYCGSQNCADAAFSPKPKFAPWVDAVMRFEGPVVHQQQLVFASDWMTYTDEDIFDAVGPTPPPLAGGFPAQAIATGPTERLGAMPDVFASLMHAAQRELLITTPYYAPNDAMQSALRSAGDRGVATTLVLPARNDDFAVACTSRSFYLDLLTAGVRILEYPLGLLHTKSVTVDGEVTLIGSANMDRRSFELNYENNILLFDRATTAAMRARQETYIADSREVEIAEVVAWPLRRRLANNALAILSPVL